MNQTPTNYTQEDNFSYEPIAQPELGKIIKDNRKAKKISQRQLGEQLGVSYQTIAYWESALRSPTPSNLIRLALALDKPENFFFCRVLEEKMEPSVSTLSENLRSYRKMFGLSQAKLSEQTGIPLVKIKAYEDGSSGQFVTDENLDKLCKVFGTKREELLGQSTTAETMQDMMWNNYQREIEIAIQKLNLVGLQKAAERISELAELPRYRK